MNMLNTDVASDADVSSMGWCDVHMTQSCKEIRGYLPTWHIDHYFLDGKLTEVIIW
jgi:hypothetical protein